MPLRKEGNLIYNTIADILNRAGIPDEIVYGTLNRSIEKLNKSPGCVELDYIDDLIPELHNALEISTTHEKLEEIEDKIRYLKTSNENK